MLYAACTPGCSAPPGLDVQVQRGFQSGSVIAAAVVGGSLQDGKAGSMSIITAFARGVPFRLIAPGRELESRFAGARGIIVAGEGAPIRTARDFKGKTIAVASLGDLESYAAQAWLDQNGGDPNAVHFVESPPPAVAAAIDQGRIDGGVVGEPLLTADLSTGKYRLLLPRPTTRSGNHWELAVIFAKLDWIESHQPIVNEKFARVVHDANVYVAAHEAEAALPLIAGFIGLNASQQKQLTHPARTPYLVPAAIQPPIDIAARNTRPSRKAFPAADMISPHALRPPARS